MTSTADRCNQAFAQIAELKDERPELGSLLDYFRALLEAQEEVRAAFRPDLSGLDVELGRSRNAEGLPFLKAVDVRVDWALFDGLLDRVVRLSAEHREVLGSSGALPEPGGDCEAWHEGLVEGFLADEVLLERGAERVGLDRDLFSFLAQQALGPFIEAYAEGLRGCIKFSTWSAGYCPTCGAEPLMARLESEVGKRSLQCGLCRTEWTFARIACPFCGSEDQDKLRYFGEEGDEAHRVEVCDVCKRYIKTVDVRKSGREAALPVENLATIHLDLIAQREGFGGKPGGFQG